MRFGFVTALFTPIVLTAFAPSAEATFHLMQIEQVIGGVNGDTTAQAIQLRMRSGSQNLVNQARLIVRNAAGAVPITLIDMTTNVASGVVGRRVLITSPNFATYTSPTVVPDFVMTNLIPASYMAAGSLTFESDTGTIYWRLSWGGAAYTGLTTGSITNDTDGNFGKLTSALPTASTQAIRFTGAATALSITNSSDYALTTGAATFTNNANANFLVVIPVTCSTCRGDMNASNSLSGADMQAFITCILTGSAATSQCICADLNQDTLLNQTDVDLFAAKLLTGPACSPP